MEPQQAENFPPIRLGMAAPEFRARTTMGERSLRDYRGRWLAFFSHPADFTPVCTSEFLSFAKAAPRFAEMGCDLLALSVDSLFSHLTWALDIEARFGIAIPFPIVEDPSMAVAQAYGMIAPGAADSSTVRATFVIDPRGIVRAMIWYPMTNGRSVEELLRLVAALQATDRTGGSTPEGWQPGGAIVPPPPLTLDEARARAAANAGDGSWYFKPGAP
jgi:peroxiredoxin (alkyl hydroperoxide reductase subunit C)